MSDEASRSAQPSGRRRSDGAPAWWAALDRQDLPDDAPSAARPAWYDRHVQPVRLRHVPGIEGMPRKHRAWLINVAAVLVAIAVIMLGVGVDSPRGALIVALLFGVPMVLVAVVAAIAARRSGG